MCVIEALFVEVAAVGSSDEYPVGGHFVNALKLKLFSTPSQVFPLTSKTLAIDN
jgi:hypothetical protein